MTDHHGHDHPHSHGIGSGDLPETAYNWRVHHPYEDIDGRVAIEISPWSGLLRRWRFVIPGDFSGVVKWGVGRPGGGEITEEVKRPASGGPVALVNGPTVIWFGAHDVLSSRLSAYLVFDGEPPHYLAFGQADEPGGPPGALEGISFAAHHEPHPHSH